jgi:prepilin-type processing-associated H-X9-DG protein
MVRRLALGLKEQLIVVAILVVLIGLVLPAVQRAREASVRARCQDNLRRLGEALHAHHDTHGRLPAGVNRYHPDLGLNRPPNGYHAWWSWMAELLPELGHDDVYRAADSWARQNPDPTSPRYWWPWGSPPDGTPANPALGQFLDTVTCPADPREAVLPASQAARPPIMVNGAVAFTGYLGVSGTHGGHGGDGQPAATFDGVLYYDSRVRLADLTAGLGQVAAVGERPPSIDLRFGWWFAGAGYDADPVMARRKYGGTGDVVLGAREHGFTRSPVLGTKCPPDQVGLRPGSVLDPCSQTHFWSFHSGGSHFLFCDGSVRFLTPDADGILPGMCTRSGRPSADDAQ